MQNTVVVNVPWMYHTCKNTLYGLHLHGGGGVIPNKPLRNFLCCLCKCQAESTAFPKNHFPRGPTCAQVEAH